MPPSNSKDACSRVTPKKEKLEEKKPPPVELRSPAENVIPRKVAALAACPAKGSTYSLQFSWRKSSIAVRATEIALSDTLLVLFAAS
jgi:hypothetical protein